VQKPDGTLRLCVDYRALNNQTVKDRYPLPLIEDLLDRLLGATVFSSDLQSGFHQICISDSDVPKTAFVTHKGLYEYLVLPFGLWNSPSLFQRAMNEVFGGLDYVACYMDDMLIFSKSEAEHKIHLAKVLALLREHQFCAKLSKCSFFKSETKFLGHVVRAQGVHVNPEKVQVIKYWPEPTTATEVRSFLGLANFFRKFKFVMGFSTMALPLIKLSTQEHDFQFDSPARTAFGALRHALSHAPILAVPDPTKGYELVCDASGFGCGAVLLQDERPVAFWSYKMLPAETRYHAGEQELLAVVRALERWQHYLEGAVPLRVVTDHKPNITLATKPSSQLSRRQVRWMQSMARFEFEWEWRKGVDNMADTLSTHPALLTTLQSAPPSVAFTERVAAGYAQDPFFADELKTRKFTFDGEFWRRNERIIVPYVGKLVEECMTMHHSAVYSGHLGKDRTIDLIVRNYWWPNLHSQVIKFVQHCDICQRTKVPTQKPAGLLQPLAILHDQWESISVDFITQLPETVKGHTAIITFVDRLTKMTHLVPTATTVGGKKFADIFIKEIFFKHGLPTSIVSDRDPRFTSDFSKEFNRQMGIEQHMSTAFHPQSDGQTERMNRYVETILRGFVNPAQDDWDTLLPLVEFAINNSYQASIKNTPFLLNYGRHPTTPANISVPVRGLPSKSKAAVIHEALRHAKACIKDAQHLMAKYANQKRRGVSFALGDFVLLHSKNLRLTFDGSKKLMHRYFGPFEIVSKVGPVAYELKIPASMQMHDVFHVSLLKLYRRGDQLSVPPPALLPDGGTEFEVHDIIGHEKNGDSYDFLVCWKGPDPDTWMAESELSRNAKDVLSEYCDTHGIVLTVSKQQACKSKRRAASRKPLSRTKKRARRA